LLAIFVPVAAGIAALPLEYDPPLIVDADGMLPGKIAVQRFRFVAGR